MCGICGIVSIGGDGPIDRDALQRMTDAMSHRGPDGQGIWVSENGRAGFGHRRLAIVDLSPLGAQPMTNEDSSIWITYNGEVYNFQTLRQDLENRGHQFRSNTDTEALVHLYEEMGEAMVDRLDGDFAFAIWDDNEQTLFLARDPVGVKPLYYAVIGGYFIFASELKAILEYPGIRRRIDKEALYHYLTYLAVPAPFSLVQDVKKVMAGQFLCVQQGGTIRKTQYWEPLPNLHTYDQSSFDEHLALLFQQSVEKRLMSDVPLGVLFSGGVDSSLNAMTFKSLVEPNPVHTYHIWMDSARYFNESDFAEKMAGYLQVQPNSRQLQESDMLSMLTGGYDYAAIQDEPLADPACISQFFVTRLARDHGMVVLQAGEGADEIFCGYDGYRNWLRREDSYWQPLSRLPKFMGTLGYLFARQLRAPFAGKIADTLRRRGLGQEFFMSEAVGYYEHEKTAVLSERYKRNMNGIDSFDLVEPYYARMREWTDNPTFLQLMTYIELRLRLPELLLMRADKISMANSIEVRVPFLDKHLVEFALSLPDSFKLRNGVSKEPIKRLASRQMEALMAKRNIQIEEQSVDELFYRKKSGFGAPIHDWFETELGTAFRKRLRRDEEETSEVFDIRRLQEYLDGKVTVNRGYQLWVIYNLLVWKDRFHLEF